jgi:hypothetical protein
MEIVKRSDSFAFTETTESYVSKGTIDREASGVIRVYFSVNSTEDHYIGDCNYSNYSDNNTVNFSLNCPEEIRKEVTTHAESVIDGILEHCKSIN